MVLWKFEKQPFPGPPQPNQITRDDQNLLAGRQGGQVTND